MPVPLLSPKELAALHAEEAQLVIMDVRLAEDHAQCAIAGSVNNCVYEVAFHERLGHLLPDHNTPVCVYGESGASHEAAMAAEKLTRAGYTRVYRLNGCLSAWCAEGLPQQGSRPIPEPAPLPTGRLTVDVTESRVEWVGRNLLNKHSGRLPLTSGHVILQEGQITGGEFVLSMHDITCDDLAGSPYHDVLIAHLRSDDFFDTDLYPQATLTITKGTLIEGATAGSQNVALEALLTLKGITAPVEFTASAGVDAEGRCAAQASLSIDRTRWNVLYGSGRFFHRLAGHLVNDWIDLQIRVVTHSA